jgi:hypothetical protein
MYKHVDRQSFCLPPFLLGEGSSSSFFFYFYCSTLDPPLLSDTKYDPLM